MRALVSLVCLSSSTVVLADGNDDIYSDADENFAYVHAIEPAVHIPEPMVFDLVRGLGAQKGELEINTLSQFPLNRNTSRDIEWAPEIEYAIADGIGLELELPFQDGKLEAYKVATQVTFSGLHRKQFLHGVQAIVEKVRGEKQAELTALYVPVFQLHRWASVVNIIGGRARVGDVRDDILLVNTTLFIEPNRETAFGFEVNVSLPRVEGATVLLMPQLYRELDENLNIQVGVGAELGQDRPWHWTAAMRLVWGTEIEVRGKKKPHHALR